SFHVQGSCHADPVLRGLEFNGFTGKDCELFWSTGGIEIPNNKYQTNNNDQSASGGPNLFWSFDMGI
ncbi:MAG: hypothetical protein V3W52_12215, partial [Syntrophobacteria bacterium]